MNRPNLFACAIGSIALLYIVAAFGVALLGAKAWKGVRR